jgi:hypothetical protein
MTKERIEVEAVLRLALEALKQMKAQANFDCWNLDICDEAITAAEEALSNHIPDAENMVAQPEQEPVIDKSAAIRIATSLGWSPQRTWVGLTDEEISTIAFNSGDEESAIHAAMDLLKEKNQ